MKEEIIKNLQEKSEAELIELLDNIDKAIVNISQEVIDFED